MKTSLLAFVSLRLRKFFPFYIFLIWILLFASAGHTQTVTTGKSFINITRPNGGTFLPGDIIEVRATIAVTGGSNSSTTRVNSVRYNDTINLTKFDYIPGTLRLLSNEGRLQHQYTDAADTDSAHIDGTTGRLRFNIGSNAAAANVNTQGNGIVNAGRLWGALRPTFFGGTCIRVYAYQVQLKTTASIVAIDSLINLPAGNFRYRIGGSTTDQLSNFPVYRIKIAPDLGLCTNAVGTNTIVGESGGTFGSGAAQNRAGGTTFVPAPYTFLNFAASAPNDNFYGLANRTSADGTTNPNIPNPNASRVHTLWDIIGDHTGATNPLLGNPPTNTGYAVIINASYETNRAFTQTITNVCEETYYEFSAWFRNICSKCGCDSSGTGAKQSGYVPGPGNDSAGVRPNLNFQVDGQDYYTSGNLAYTGQWVKKGFVFKTRPGQTSFNVTIRNNAPGGGGNDWAIDDIQVATCLPNMTYSPSLTPNICEGSPLRLEDTIRSYFNNFTYYKWQRSTNGGSTWTDVTGVIGPVATFWNGTAYEYVASYTIPATQTTMANDGDQYRAVISTSTNNITLGSCRVLDPNVITLNVLDNVVQCPPPLSTKLTGVTAVTTAGVNQIKWITSDETEALYFDIERSTDARNFSLIATISSYHRFTTQQQHYTYADPYPVNQNTYYRIRMRSIDDRALYSHVLHLQPRVKESFAFVSVLNPFNDQLRFDVSSARTGPAKAELVDRMGNIAVRKTVEIQSGISHINFNNTAALLPGIYILKLEMNGMSIYRTVLKQYR
jgi:trimeric autotransporter adhesin